MTGGDSTRHGTAVAVDGAGLLLLGPSGAGKSSMALMLLAMGAVLVGDDRVRLWRHGGRVMADAAPALAGLVEARGVGILRAAHAGPVPLALVCDLGRDSPARLPRPRARVVLGVPLPLVCGRADVHLAVALRQILRGSFWPEECA